MKLIVVHGAPGVGKLTVARELQKLTGFPVFHNHLTVDLLAAEFDFHSRVFTELREELWLLVMTRGAREGLDGLIFTLVFEPTLLAGFYERLKSSVEPAGGTLHPFELRCALEEHLNRVVQPERGRYLKMTSPEGLRISVREGAYEPPADMAGNVVIDTATLSPTETARIIAEHL